MVPAKRVFGHEFDVFQKGHFRSTQNTVLYPLASVQQDCAVLITYSTVVRPPGEVRLLSSLLLYCTKAFNFQQLFQPPDLPSPPKG